MNARRRVSEKHRWPILIILGGAVVIALFYLFIALDLFGFGEPTNIGAGLMPLFGICMILMGLYSLFLREGKNRSGRE